MRRTLVLAVVGVAVLAAGSLFPAARGAAEIQKAAQPLISPTTEDDDVVEVDPNAPDLRVVVAAPRAAITGGLGSVLTRARVGRTINAITGDTVRFVAGMKEAVWYSGAGRVESGLRIVGLDPNGQPLPLGSDQLVINGRAPKIDFGRTRVDVSFLSLGAFPLEAVVSVSALPRNGSGVNRTNRVPYIVHVWNAGDLGEITGTVTDSSDASPLEGFRVVALDAGLGTLEAVAYTHCDGVYNLRRLPPASYLVAVRGARGFASEFFDDAPDPNSAMAVAVSAGAPTSGIDFELTR